MALLTMAILTVAILTVAMLRLHVLRLHVLRLHVLWFYVPWPPAAQRVVPGGRCHENDIVREFRLFYPRYRRCETRWHTSGPPAVVGSSRSLWRAWRVWGA
jgi:hypothetical protein